MSLGFILGKASTDRQAVLLEEISKCQKEDPKAKIYYLVPNHIKFDSEVRILEHLAKQNEAHDLFATTALQVLSFSRLAWYFMKDRPEYQAPRLSQAGANMLVYKILREQKEKLTLFFSEQTRPGFITKLAKQLLELSTSLITSEDLKQSYQALEKEISEQDLLAKLHDLFVVYHEFEQLSQGKVFGTAPLLVALKQHLEKMDLSHSYFFLDGFSQFNASEMQVLESLMLHAKEVKVALVLDKAYVEKAPETSELFYRAGLTYHRLYQSARSAQVPVLLDQKAKVTRVSSDLVELEKYWIASNKLIGAQTPAELNGDLQVIAADDRVEEVRYLATTIRQLVLEKGYRYRDILVLSRHLDPYKNILEPTFKQFDIPVFIDLQKKMSDHPLVEFLNALLLVEQRGYRYEDLMRLLKTELLVPKDLSLAEFRNDLDLAENQVLRFGYQKKGWLEKDWVYSRFMTNLGTRTKLEDEITQKINVIRRFVSQVLPPFYEKLATAQNGQQAAEILLAFLQTNGVLDQLENWRQAALENDDLNASRREEQVWGVFCDLLDEYVEILGEEPFVVNDFLELLKAGFEGATYSQVPTTLDQVVISETGMVQPEDKKIVFLLGATDLVMPDVAVNETLLSDKERSELSTCLTNEQYLADNTEQILANEPFLNYLAFLTPTEKLYLSYPLTSGDEAELKCSPYVERIKDALELPLLRVSFNNSFENVTAHLGTKRTTLSELLRLEHLAYEKRQDLSDEWRYVRQKLQSEDLFERLEESLRYKNIPERLSAASVKGLYGTKLNTSISRLEDFYADPYEYFLKYGLGLREREIFELNAANTGEYFHTLLDTFFKLLLRERRELKQLSAKEFDQYFTRSLESIAQMPQFAILDSSNRMRFLTRQLNKTAKQVGYAIKQQRNYNDVQTLQTEVLFGHIGQEKGLAGLEFLTPSKKLVQVRGKIDRIDDLVVEGKHYLNLVDYKSGAKKFEHAKAYFGLALQLLTYLDALAKNKQLIVSETDPDKIELAGALYMHLYDPTFKQKELYTRDYATEVLKKNKYQGLLVDQAAVLEKLDARLVDETGPSLIYPFRKNRDGTYRGSSAQNQLLTFEQLQALLAHNEELIKQAAEMIFAGRIDLAPARWSDGSALTYSPYEAIMQFDAMLPENNYYRLPTENTADILRFLAEEQVNQEEK